MNYLISINEPWVSRTEGASRVGVVFGSFQEAKQAAIAAQKHELVNIQQRIKTIRGLKECDLPLFGATGPDGPRERHSPAAFGVLPAAQPNPKSWQGGAAE